MLVALLLPLTASAQRIALVVGNAAYIDRPLRNPVNDAQLMQATLRDLGFEVQMATNVDRRGLLGALRDFEARARGAEVALFYFAGHGAQVGGANYLIPINAPIRSETDVPDEALDAAGVLRRIEEGRTRVGLVILDACRDNPFPGSNRSSTRGLARMAVPTGTIVAYATAPGNTAEDGTGANGTYTAALARYLSTPGLDIKEIFDRTAQEVERVTNGKQRPREEIGLRGRFLLRDVAGASSVAAVPPTPLPQGQAGGINLSDLVREQQAREAWADWQQRMQADFESVGALKAPDLRVQAWQRFLQAWKDDNPTGIDDERLREQARQGLAVAQREVLVQQEARAREDQRLREQAAEHAALREPLARQEWWARWQRQMRADFERISALQAPDLRVPAWQRFLATWAEDNRTTGDDEHLRGKTREGLAAAQREVQAQQEAQALEAQRLRVQGRQGARGHDTPVEDRLPGLRLPP